MTSRNDLERAALAALEQWWSQGRAGTPLPIDTVRLTRAADELIFDCPECNRGGHACPGCGAHVWHYGPRACADCGGPQHDPISGDLIPAGQDAELEQMGREMAEVEHLAMPREQRRLELEVLEASAVHYESQTEVSAGRPALEINGVGTAGVVRERMTALADYHGSITHLQADTDQELAEYRPAPDPEPRWIERTAADVRRGDRIRMPGQDGTETLVIDRYLPPQPPTPGGGLPSDRNTWHVVPGERGHWDDHVVQPGECWLLLTGRDKPFNFPPTMPVEILLTPAEAAAIDALGWENRA